MLFEILLKDLFLESKAFRNEEAVRKFSIKEMSEIFYSLMLTLQLLSLTRYSNDAKSYVNDTLQYSMFDHIYLSTTDLANVITTLKNSREILNQPNVDLPILDIKRYFRDYRSGTMNNAEKMSFFYRLQSKLKISNSYLTAFRRDIVDTENLTFSQKRDLGHRLYQLLRGFEYKCDLLSILQRFMDDSRE